MGIAARRAIQQLFAGSNVKTERNSWRLGAVQGDAFFAFFLYSRCATSDGFRFV
jgi:hypothetical protein